MYIFINPEIYIFIYKLIFIYFSGIKFLCCLPVVSHMYFRKCAMIRQNSYFLHCFFIKSFMLYCPFMNMMSDWRA